MRKIIVTLSTAAALLTLGSAAAQASVNGNRPDATPACGAQCFDLSSLELGPHTIQNAYIRGDNGIGGKVGQRLNLRHASNSRPNEDFTGAKVGTLSNYCGSLISSTSYVCVNYPGNYPVFESSWSPFGNDSGLCAGIARRNVAGQNVTLQPCGASARTMWVGDLADSVTNDGRFYTPWVNASDPNFSHPLVLTVDAGTYLPENQLKVQRLNLLTGHTVADSQEYTLEPGPAA
ncbi:MAG TPA: hypothetical protein VMU94_04965 [Streptosporangiaceae bacterium]|nr:hypothetical protein [Streptosporangiaceae bacterium]